MRGESWPLYQPVAGYLAAFDVVGFSRNIEDPGGLLQDRAALFRAIEDTALFRALKDRELCAHFLGDEVRLAIRGGAVERPSDVLDFAEHVHLNLRRHSEGAREPTSARAVVLNGPLLAKASHECCYLAGPTVDKAQRWMASGAVAGGGIATDVPCVGWDSANVGDDPAYVRHVYRPSSDNSVPPIIVPTIENGKNSFVVGIAVRASEAAVDSVLPLIDDAVEATRIPHTEIRISVGPSAVLIGIEDDTVDRVSALIRALRVAVARSTYKVSAVVTMGSVIEVARPWVSSNFEGGAAIVAARVLAKIPQGAIAYCGPTLKHFFPSIEGLKDLEVPGKRGERFAVKIEEAYFASGRHAPMTPVAAAGPGPASLVPATPTRDEAAQPDVGRILFDIYDAGCEPYYVARPVDEEIARLLEHSGLWISGPAGTGKTSSVRRALTRSGKKFAYLSFANCLETSPASLIAHAYYELAGVCNAAMLEAKPRDASDAIVRMVQMLSASTYEYLYIDEIPTDSVQVQRDITRALTGLVVAHATRFPQGRLKYVLSSIHSPVDYVKGSQLLFERTRLLELRPWDEPDIARLICDLGRYLRVLLNDGEMSRLRRAALGSPRFVKNCFRKMVFGAPAALRSVDAAIAATATELT